MYRLPRQKISSKEKNERHPVTGKTWGEDTIDYFIDEISVTEREEIISNYRLIEGILNEEDYDYVLNPYNTTIDRYKRFGATLRNYDIISPVINLYTGEFNQRFKNFQVLESNSGEDNDYKESLNDLITDYYRQQAINDINALGIDSGDETVEQGQLQEKIDSFNEDYDETRIISGQEILEFIYNDQDLDDKYQDAYKDWVVAGRAITYKGIHHNDIDFEVVPPWQFTFPLNLRSNFIEDAPWCIRRQIMTSNQILDRWHDKLSEAQVEWLEAEGRDDGFTHARGYTNLPSQWISNREDYANHSILQEIHGIEVYHVQWRSFRKVGLLTTIDELGQPEEVEVDDTYRMDKEAGDVSIEWGWQSEVWEGWRLGHEYTNIYIEVRPLPYNRMELNNSSTQKLSYNGRVNRTVSGTINSLVTAGRPYQLIFNILHYQLEKAINKNKGKVMVIPQGVIPKGINGWDEEKFMYYTDASGMLIIDETQPTAGLALQAIKPIDLSMGQFAKDSIELMQHVKQEYWDLIGMNRQRYGDAKASDGKGVNEQAIFRSSIISDELFRKFEKFQEKDYAGFLDLSKLAYIDGKKGKYVNSQGREAFLNLNADDAIHKLESDYNIHVKNSNRESENIQMAKEYGFSLGQNGDAPTMLELIESTNFTKTKAIVEKIDEMNKQREEAQAQAERDNALAIEESQTARDQAKDELERYKVDTDYDKAIDVKELELQDNDRNNNGVPDNTRDGGDGGDDNRESLNETRRLNNHKINLDNANLKLSRRDQTRKDKETDAKIKEMKKRPTTSK
jgi:hypothetical protein